MDRELRKSCAGGLTRTVMKCMLYSVTTSTAYQPEELINLSQAAKVLGVSYPTVFALIRRGELESVKIADRQYLAMAEVEELKQRRNGKSR